MRFIVSRSKPRRSLPRLLLFCALFTIIGLLLLNLSSIDAPTGFLVQDEIRSESVEPVVSVTANRSSPSPRRPPVQSSCATVEEMGEEAVSEEATWKESHRVRRIIRDHFEFYGAPRVQELPPEQFCKQGFVLGKASEAGFGNEMYKILTAAGLSVMLNRFQGTTDAVAAQFFLKNIHPPMRSAASALFGKTELLRSRPNIFGELMRVIISPSRNVKEAVDWVLNGGPDPHLVLHMRMLMNRSPRAVMAATNCVKKALLRNCPQLPKPRVVLVSDTPSVINDITPKLQEFAEVLRFDYNLFKGNISSKRTARMKQLGFRVKDWGPAPRWVAFVDFFLASRAKHAVVSGAHRRVGTTYAQLIAALAEAHHRGPLSCRHQHHQCALTPLLPPGWWDGILQSPIPRDINRLEAYGVKLDVIGTVDGNHLRSFCKSRKYAVKTIPVSRKCGGLTCA
ncbi:hypothetical protein Acr_26g0006120 [Actinidia rufa]|uniref:Uncharacterized protein n=1 Tax=Actinidia rufa TaxID=165716 RepID=A0A7J0H2T1_9ERIC|nr:hypothetical protein Acr_26g0006120 [Actinidia rufa]